MLECARAAPKREPTGRAVLDVVVEVVAHQVDGGGEELAEHDGEDLSDALRGALAGSRGLEVGRNGGPVLDETVE